MVRDIPYVSKRANRNTWASYWISPSPIPTYPKPRGCKPATTGWAHHVWSSSGMITIVVMALFCLQTCASNCVCVSGEMQWTACITIINQSIKINGQLRNCQVESLFFSDIKLWLSPTRAACLYTTLNNWFIHVFFFTGESPFVLAFAFATFVLAILLLLVIVCVVHQRRKLQTLRQTRKYPDHVYHSVC